MSTASVPNAISAIVQFIERRSGVPVRIDDSHTDDWQSLTFRGDRVRSSMWADGIASAVKPTLAALVDAEFAIPGQIIADIAVTNEPQDVPTRGGCTFTIDVLCVDDDPDA